jgi:hypothetical protein
MTKSIYKYGNLPRQFYGRGKDDPTVCPQEVPATVTTFPFVFNANGYLSLRHVGQDVDGFVAPTTSLEEAYRMINFYPERVTSIRDYVRTQSTGWATGNEIDYKVPGLPFGDYDGYAAAAMLLGVMPGFLAEQERYIEATNHIVAPMYDLLGNELFLIVYQVREAKPVMLLDLEPRVPLRSGMMLIAAFAAVWEEIQLVYSLLGMAGRL